MSNVNNEVLLIVFVALTGAAVLMQACVLLALYISVRKTAKLVEEQMSEVRSTVLPAVSDARNFIARVGPKLDSVATDLAEVSRTLRIQGVELQISASEVLERVRRQSSRLDAMFSDVLDTVDRAGTVVTEVVNMPLRQLSGIAAFAKAAISSLRSGNGARQGQPTHSAADKDLFV